jgi:hypothetical protein
LDEIGDPREEPLYPMRQVLSLGVLMFASRIGWLRRLDEITQDARFRDNGCVFNGLDYAGLTLGFVMCRETVNGKTTTFAWLLDLARRSRETPSHTHRSNRPAPRNLTPTQGVPIACKLPATPRDCRAHFLDYHFTALRLSGDSLKRAVSACYYLAVETNPG